MKATGIVRRIDELGRIVIPKEIRRTMRIREMDSIEIYTAGDGEIILKKYTPMGEMITFAKDYAESLAKITGNIICITDKENVVAASGNGKKNLENSSVSRGLSAAMTERKNIFASSSDKEYVPIIEDKDGGSYSQEIISPIIADGDILGTVIMLGKDVSRKFTSSDERIVAIAADFIGRHLAS